MGIQRILKEGRSTGRDGMWLEKGRPEPIHTTVRRLCDRLEALERDVVELARRVEIGASIGAATIADRIADRVVEDEESS